MQVISRKEALNKGLKHYFTGKPCKKGHLSYRLTACQHCFACKNPKYSEEALRLRDEILTDPRLISRDDAIKLNKTRYFTGVPCSKGHISERLVSGWSCIECTVLTRKAFLDKNPGKHSEYRRNSYANNPIPALTQVNLRRSYKLQRSPAWADQVKIKQIYQLCKDMNDSSDVKYEVDHIVPLKGKVVSGLHVHENLQIITIHDNRTKRNKFNIEEYNAP